MAPWQQTSEATFSRPIGENETFIKLVSDPGHPLGREHWAINAVAALAPKGDLVSQLPLQLRQAWAHLRFQHPSLAAYPEGEQLIYKVPSSAELDEWVDHTFTIDDHASSAADVIRNAKPDPSATLTFVTKSGELLGHTAHWRTDGIGLPLLLDALLKLAVTRDLSDPNTLPWGEESSRLAPAVEDAAGIPEQPNESQKALGQACLATFGLAGGAVGIPFAPTAVPQGTLSARTTLSAPLTQRVVEAAKDRHISLTSAVHASVAFANWKLADESRKAQHYTSTVRFALRPYLPEPFSTPAYAGGLYTTGWMEKVEPTETWENIAAYYHNIYQKGISRDYLDAHREYAKGLGDMLRTLPADLPPASDVDISSIGIAEHLIGRSHGSEDWGVDVTAVGVGVEILTPQAVCFVWTFRDQLNLSVVFNEAFHSEAQMHDFVESAKAILVENLQVEGD